MTERTMIHAGPYIRGTIDRYLEQAASHRAQSVHLMNKAEEQRLLAEDAEKKAVQLAEGTDYVSGDLIESKPDA